ncbi:hypothetical protein L228DRAFT_249961 [Xylona heveae TC161]|uniref:Mitochondrial ribosomal protein-like protein n=1 Tax=Xylona heveae (strain CBS 132557 / TC161) TaxID=1328760 RepID=A0A165ADC0_XYLHT|nr:hypothetical protein L228DRAFT_249961 [Xylona heveae TC161]KZF20290.1 hypothetical protein L228DRAFT_249961 [Xylona heveae TC161]
MALNLSSTMRPLSCWKSIFRSTRCVRQLTTATPPSASTIPPRIGISALAERSLSAGPKKIKTYPPPPSARVHFKEPISDVTAAQLTTLDPTGARTRMFARDNSDAAKVGDILLVRQRNGDPFAGVCLNIRRRGVDTGILLRNQLTRVGVEMWFKIYSPNVEGIEVVQRREKRARRARLYYMRQPKHDVGSVQNIVLQYQRRSAVLRSGGEVRGRDANSGKRKGKKR